MRERGLGRKEGGGREGGRDGDDGGREGGKWRKGGELHE